MTNHRSTEKDLLGNIRERLYPASDKGRGHLAGYLLGLLAHLVGLIDRVLDRAGSLVERAADQREHPLPEDEQRHGKDDQRPNDDPHIGEDQERAAATGEGDDHRRLEEEGDEPADQAVEERGLGEGEAQPLIALDVLAQLRLARLGLDRGVEHEADTRTGAGGATRGTHAQRDRLQTLLSGRLNGCRRRPEHRVEKTD